MKYSKKRDQFEASNVTFSLQNCQAFSYSWWKFVDIINGVIVFNNATYSPTTNKHQSKVRTLMRDQGIMPQLVLRFTKRSLSLDALTNEIVESKGKINEIELILSNSRRKKALDTSRQAMVECLKQHIKQVELVIHGTELNVSLN